MLSSCICSSLLWGFVRKILFLHFHIPTQSGRLRDATGQACCLYHRNQGRHNRANNTRSQTTQLHLLRAHHATVLHLQTATMAALMSASGLHRPNGVGNHGYIRSGCPPYVSLFFPILFSSRSSSIISS